MPESHVATKIIPIGHVETSVNTALESNVVSTIPVGIYGSANIVEEKSAQKNDRQNTMSANLSEHDIKVFADRLNNAVDFYQLFDTFIEELRKVVFCDSIEYDNEKTQTSFKCGISGSYCCSYDLNYDEKPLGSLRITRDERISEDELKTIELMLAGLVLPLRNTLRYQEIIRFSERDELTGLRNGHHYHDLVELEIKRTNHYNKPFSLLTFNLDDFERINQQYGRTAGDSVIFQVAGRIENEARRSDVVYRKSGDEFLVFLPNTEKEEALIAAKRIKDYVLSSACVYDNKNIVFTLSAGVVSVTHGDTATKLINRADKALFQAKISGKDRIFAGSIPSYTQTGFEL